MDLRKLPVAIGVFGAEPWSNAMRDELESKLDLKAVDIYGLSEILGPGVAMECHVAQAGLHVWEDHFLFEIIDPKTLETLPDGETGELVITTLTKEALPMVRYRTRDITRFSNEQCVCGRTHRRMMRITGRDDDMLIIRGVNVYPSQVEAVLVSMQGIAPHYQFVVSQNGPMTALRVEVEVSPDAADDQTSRKAKATEVKHQIKSMIGVTCDVEVMKIGAVPRSEGKAVRVRDLRQ